MAKWAIVLECAAQDGAWVPLDDMDRLIVALAPWQASALHNPDRYALQVVVDAPDTQAALRTALEVHGEAIRTLRLPAWEVVRTEGMTLSELERSWDAGFGTPTAAPRHIWEASPSFATRLHESNRALLQARSAADLTSVLTRFVQGSGGWLVAGDAGTPWMLPVDLTLGQRDRVFAAAEPFSTARLLLEETLPGLVADAERVLDLMHCHGCKPRPANSVARRRAGTGEARRARSS